MPGNDQDFVDFVLSSISNDMKKVGEYSGEFFDSFDRQFQHVSDNIREAIQGSSWIPENVKAAAPPPPPPRAPARVSMGYLEHVGTWMNRNRAWTAAVMAFAGTTLFLVLRSRRAHRQKRKARKAATGAKTEVVILSGSPYSALTKLLALDLERKGFLVYIPVGSFEEESAVAELRNADIHSLSFDISSPDSVSEMVAKFSSFLQHPHRHGTTSLHLASLILLPPHPSPYPTGPAHHLSTQRWSDNLNTHLLYPLAISNTFIPLLLSQNPVFGLSSLVLLTPSTISSLQAPHHATESVITTGLSSYLSTLRAELPRSIPIAHLRLGALDISEAPSETAVAKSRYVYDNATTRATVCYRSRGKDIRELNNSVFDAVVGRTKGTVFVGRGARTYAIVGALAPRGLVAWMMGAKKNAWMEKTWGEPRKLGARRGSDESVGSEGSRQGSDGQMGGSAEWERVEQGPSQMRI